MSEEIPAIIVMFGGSGDLAQRKLYPALFGLYRRGILKDHFAVIGTARRPWSDDHYRAIVEAAVVKDNPANATDATAFAAHFYYQSHDVTDADHYITLKNLAAKLDKQVRAGGNRLFYMAMAPTFFATIAEHLKSEALLTDHGFNRLIIEKPFGHDYESAAALNASITATFAEDQIYRIDHYLGKEMAQAIMGLRFGNGLIRALWNKDFIQDIQITLAEAVGVEERAGYYDTAGALRDMVQNHIMQLFAYLTMEEPQSLTPEAVHAVKQAAFDHLVRLEPAAVACDFVRGQYVGATVDGTALAGYRSEDGVAPESHTETFVAGKLMTDTPALAGVPVYIRTGKRLTRKSTQITITFKPQVAGVCGDQPADHLTIYVEPSEGYSLHLNGKVLGQTNELEQEELRFRHDETAAAAAPGAYDRLIADALHGDQTNFNHWTELAQTWRYVDVILAVWAKDEAPLETYPAGSMGPKAADELLEQDGHRWFWQPKTVKLAD